MRCALSACGRRRRRRVHRGGRRRAAVPALLHTALPVRFSRSPFHCIRCGGVALGRRPSAVAACTLSAVFVVVGCGARSLQATADGVVASSGRSPSRYSRGAAARNAARALLETAVPPHPMRRCVDRLPLLCGGGSCSQRDARRGRWRRELSECGRWRGRHVTRAGRCRAVLAASLCAASRLRSSRPPCRCIRCGGVALGRRSSAAASGALSAVNAVVGGGVSFLRAAADGVVASFGAVAVALLSRFRCTRRRSCPPYARRSAASDAAVWRSAAAPLRWRLVLSARCASWSVVARALCGRPPTGSSRPFRAVVVALLSRRRCTRCRSYACRALRSAASDAAVWRSAAAPLRWRLALSARCSSWSVAARALCRRPLAGLSRPSGRSSSCCSRGAAARVVARVHFAPTVPPHPMRRCGAQPPLLCGDGSCSQRGARRGRLRRLLSACGRWRGRHVPRCGRRRAAVAAPLHAASLVCSSRLPFHRIRRGGVALGRRSSAAVGRALSAVRAWSVAARALCV